MNDVGVLKCSCHRYFLGRGLLCSLSKKLCKMKYGIEGSFLVADLGLC